MIGWLDIAERVNFFSGLALGNLQLQPVLIKPNQLFTVEAVIICWT